MYWYRDTRCGRVEQIQRHFLILGLLNIPKIILAIKKMDLINYDYIIYKNIIFKYKITAHRVGLKNIEKIPKKSHLETYIFSVQYVILSKESNKHHLHGYAEKIISGIYREVDEIIVNPNNFHTRIKYMEMGIKRI